MRKGIPIELNAAIQIAQTYLGEDNFVGLNVSFVKTDDETLLVINRRGFMELLASQCVGI